MKFDEIVEAVQAKNASITGDHVEEVLQGLDLTPEQVKPNMIGEIVSLAKDIKSVQIVPSNGGSVGTRAPKATPIFVPAETAPTASRPTEVAPAAVASDEDPEAALEAKIEALRKKRRIAELEQQLLDAEAELLAADTQLKERKAAHELQVAAAEKLTDLAVKNGTELGKNAIARQEQALGEYLTVSQETPLDCEIGVVAMRQRQMAQRNKLQAVLNATPAALPPMSQETGRSEVRTVETVAV